MRSPPGRAARLGLSALGLGHAPVAPGTVASAATALGLGLLLPSPGAFAWAAALLAALASAWTLRFAGRVEGEGVGKDPGWVVSDEVAGQSLACLAALAGGGWLAIGASFALFRLLDVGKPGPIRRAERLPGGLGVLLDDLLAGACAGALVAGAAWALG